MNKLKIISSFLAILFLSNIAFAQKKVKDTFLNKKYYLVEVTMIGGKKQKIFADELSFTSGKIKSKHLSSPDEGGFLQGDYGVTKVDSSGEAKSIDFKGTCKNSKNENLIITGTVFGDMIDGSMTWETSKHKVKSEMTFTGNLKEKGQKFVPAEKTSSNPSSKQKSSESKSSETKKGNNPDDTKSSGKKSKEELLDEEILNDEE